MCPAGGTSWSFTTVTDGGAVVSSSTHRTSTRGGTKDWGVGNTRGDMLLV